jgi:hypothetical protein
LPLRRTSPNLFVALFLVIGNFPSHLQGTVGNMVTWTDEDSSTEQPRVCRGTGRRSASHQPIPTAASAVTRKRWPDFFVSAKELAKKHRQVGLVEDLAQGRLLRPGSTRRRGSRRRTPVATGAAARPPGQYLSRTADMPKWRTPPSRLGIDTRRTGNGRYTPLLSFSANASRDPSTPSLPWRCRRS